MNQTLPDTGKTEVLGPEVGHILKE